MYGKYSSPLEVGISVLYIVCISIKAGLYMSDSVLTLPVP